MINCGNRNIKNKKKQRKKKGNKQRKHKVGSIRVIRSHTHTHTHRIPLCKLLCFGEEESRDDDEEEGKLFGLQQHCISYKTSYKIYVICWELRRRKMKKKELLCYLNLRHIYNNKGIISKSITYKVKIKNNNNKRVPYELCLFLALTWLCSFLCCFFLFLFLLYYFKFSAVVVVVRVTSVHYGMTLKNHSSSHTCDIFSHSKSSTNL